ncbi:MAG: hypothetical protein MUO54_10950 [Anaerolineales bacterium]|nr:hypothetical protein [Anaerolineales bacterium]
MENLKRIRFWQLMVGTGFVLLVLGLVMIFLPPGQGNTDPFVIEFFEASIESSEMGLALIVMGLSCFLIGRKDLADLRAYQSVQKDLQKTSKITARLVANRVERTLNGVSDTQFHMSSLGSNPELDVAGTRLALKEIRNGKDPDQKPSRTIHEAERGMDLLEALEGEGFSI